jgi:hypothetical protein
MMLQTTGKLVLTSKEGDRGKIEEASKFHF